MPLQKTPLVPSTMWIQEGSVCSQEADSHKTSNLPCFWSFQPPELYEMNFSCLKATRFPIFCYTLRQIMSLSHPEPLDFPPSLLGIFCSTQPRSCLLVSRHLFSAMFCLLTTYRRTFYIFQISLAFKYIVCLM